MAKKNTRVRYPPRNTGGGLLTFEGAQRLRPLTVVCIPRIPAILDGGGNVGSELELGVSSSCICGPTYLLVPILVFASAVYLSPPNPLHFCLQVGLDQLDLVAGGKLPAAPGVPELQSVAEVGASYHSLGFSRQVGVTEVCVRHGQRNLF